jgi:5-methylcytosine-specific restriction endonuclease McrA
MHLETASWTTCLREPITETEVAAQYLREAVNFHSKGDRDAAAELIRKADMPVIAEWVNSLGGKNSQYVLSRLRLDTPRLKRSAARSDARMPNAATKRELLARDGYRCRFCSTPLIRSEVRQRIRIAYPDELRWERRNTGQHAAFQAMWVQYDHIIPVSRGGRNDLSNLVLACAGCNFGRMSHTLHELQLLDPRTVPARKTEWDGLERFGHKTIQTVGNSACSIGAPAANSSHNPTNSGDVLHARRACTMSSPMYLVLNTRRKNMREIAQHTHAHGEIAGIAERLFFR